MSTASKDAPKPKTALQIDKSTTVNVGILIVVLAGCVGAAVKVNDLQHGLDTANSTLKEVKAELASQNGTTMAHTRQLTILEQEVKQLHRDRDAHETRLKALEKGK